MMLDGVKATLGLTKSGREILEAAQAEETRRKERRAAAARLAEAREMEAGARQLREARDQAQAKAAAAAKKAAAAKREAGQAQATYVQAAQATARVLRRAENALRRTAPPLIADAGPVLAWLRDHRDHIRSHAFMEDELNRMRHNLRDHERQGSPRKHADAMARLRKDLERAETALEILPAFEDAIGAVRDLQLEEDPDLPAAVREILEDSIPEQCACGKSFETADALLDTQLTRA